MYFLHLFVFPYSWICGIGREGKRKERSGGRNAGTRTVLEAAGPSSENSLPRTQEHVTDSWTVHWRPAKDIGDVSVRSYYAQGQPS